MQAASLYHHFADKKAIEEALGLEAARLLHAELAVPRVRNNIERMAKAYLKFARLHPQLYFLIASRPSSSDASPEAKSAWNLLLEAVSSLSGEPDDTDAAVAIWSYLHGFAALEAAGKFGASGPHHGFERGIRAMLIGLRAQPQSLNPPSGRRRR